MKTAIAIISLFIVLSIIDFTTTIYAVGNGIGQEGNVLMAYALKQGFYSIVKAGGIVLISLFLAKLSRRHEKAFKVAGYLAIAITLIAVVNNFMVINASAIVIGHNVKAVGAGYSNFYGSDYHEFVYWTSDDGGEIHLVTLDDSGMVVSDTTIVTNVSAVRGLCIDKDGYVWFSIDHSNNNYDGIWKRNTKSTNPLSFEDLKDDVNYFVHVSTTKGYDLTPIGNRIYYRTSSAIYYAHGATESVLVNTGSWEIAASGDYVYSLHRRYLKSVLLEVYNADGNLVQSVDVGYREYSGTEGVAGLLIFLSDDKLKIHGRFFNGAGTANGQRRTITYLLNDNGTINESSRTEASREISYPEFMEELASASEIYNSNFIVYINSNYQAEIYISDSVFIPDEGSGGGGGGTGTTQYYNVTLRFVNAETNQELSNVYVKGYVYYNGEIYQSINGYYDYNLTLTVPAGSNIEIGQAHKDLFESDLEKEQYTLTIMNVQSDTERIIYFYPLALKTTLEVYFIDTSTKAQIPDVNFILEDNEGNVIANGTYDYSASFEVWVGKTYYWNASKEGYFNDSGSVSITTNQITYVVWAYLTPVKTPSDVTNNTIVEFIVKKNPGYAGGEYYPLAGAVVTLNGESRVTNSNGYTYFEVAKNSTCSYIVSADGYYSKSGIVTVETEPVLVEVVLDLIVTPPTITGGAGGGGTGGSGGSTGGGTGGGSGGTGYTPDEDLRQAARDTLTQFYKSVPGFFGLIFLLFVMAAMKSVMRR